MALRLKLLFLICTLASLASVLVLAQSSRAIGADHAKLVRTRQQSGSGRLQRSSLSAAQSSSSLQSGAPHTKSAAAARVATPSSGLNFLAAVSYASGGHGAFAITVGDLNADGKPDLVVADWCSTTTCSAGTVAVLLGNGDGTFQTAVSYASGGVFANSMAIADLRGNGTMDIIVGNCGSVQRNICVGTNGGVGVLLGNGNGTFQPAVPYSAAFGVASVTAADVNADGKMDLLLATNCGSAGSYTGCVGVLSGNGDGTFAAAVTYTSGGFSPTSIAVHDVNGDSKLDVVVAHCGLISDNACGTGNAGVLLGNGDGTFAAGVVYNSNGIYSQGVAVGDVNGDGKADVVVVNSSISLSNLAGNLGVLLGNGDGTFQAAVAYPSGGFGGASVALADVNGDGKLDIGVANCSTTAGNCTGTSGTEGVGILLGNGDGTFQTAVTFASGGNTPFGLAVADLNGDSKPDVATANCAGSNCGLHIGAVGVLLNASLGGTSTTLASSANPSTFGQSVTFTATVTSGFKGTPAGTVNFFDGTTSLGTSGLDGTGAASFTTASLAEGTHSITGTYSGDGNFVTSTSPVLSQIVQEAIAQISPTSVAFGVQTVGISSTPRNVTLTNTGNIPLTVAISMAGANAADFAQTNNCGASVAAGSSCTITVTFKPTAIGVRTAAVSITDNAPNSPQQITLRGTGTYVLLAPKSLNFGNQAVGTKSVMKKITLTNKGSVALSIPAGGITIVGTNAPDFAQINNCGTSVAPGASCLIGVTFTPSATGVRSAGVSISDNGGGSPQLVALTGTGT